MSRRSHAALALVTVAVAAGLFGLGWARFEAVHNRTFDLALYARIAWGLAHGDFWSPVLDRHALGVHFAPVLWPLGWLGRAFGAPVSTLLAAQSVAVAACCWPLARIGQRRLGTSGLWLGPLAWLLYPNLGHVTTYEFHPGTLAVLPLCWAADAVDRGSARQLAVALAGACLCREDLALGAAVYGVALGGLHGRWRPAAALTAACLAYGACASAVVWAHSPARVLAEAPHQASSLDQHFGAWGGSPLGVLPALLREPGQVWDHFTTPARLLYLPKVLAPCLWLSLRAPWLLAPAAPWLALNLISAFPTTEQLYSHYLTPAVPPIVSSALVGLGTLRASWARPAWAAALAVGHALAGGTPLARDFDRAAFTADDQTRAARRVLARIPADARVQAPDGLLPHLSTRPAPRRGPPPDVGADWVVLDVSHRARYAGREDLLRTLEEPRVRRWLARSDYATALHAPPYLLLARGADPRAALLATHRLRRPRGAPLRSPSVRLCACLQARVLGLDEQLRLALHARDKCPEDLAVRFGSEPSARRVELLFAGAFSPAQLRAGDRVWTSFPLRPAERRGIALRGLWLGALRSSGAPPSPTDPPSVRVLPGAPDSSVRAP